MEGGRGPSGTQVEQQQRRLSRSSESKTHFWFLNATQCLIHTTAAPSVYSVLLSWSSCGTGGGEDTPANGAAKLYSLHSPPLIRKELRVRAFFFPLRQACISPTTILTTHTNTGWAPARLWNAAEHAAWKLGLGGSTCLPPSLIDDAFFFPSVVMPFSHPSFLQHHSSSSSSSRSGSCTRTQRGAHGQGRGR